MEMKSKLLIGCFADDFTGASDIGSFFKKGGLKTQLVSGLPQDNFIMDESTQVLIIALKSRSQEISTAVKDSLAACEYFKKHGAGQIYFKYCSTFDSTKEGNIGPVIDAVLEKYKIPFTVLCPSLPVNGRVVKNGELLVHGIPLHESPMKNHPVNPMWASNIRELMSPQGKYEGIELPVSVFDNKSGTEVADQYIKTKPFYLIPDYYEDDHGSILAKAFVDLPFITGGSGLAEFVSRELNQTGAGLENNDTENSNGVEGPSLILAGSCSTATKEQVKKYIEDGGESVELDPYCIISDEEILKKILSRKNGSVLIHTTGNSPTIRETENPNLSQQEISQLLEKKMAGVAVKSIEKGIKRIITAGGETSGEITKALGFTSFLLGAEVAPGVPVLIPSDNKDIRLVLKSGNFGQKDFFQRALKITSNC